MVLFGPKIRNCPANTWTTLIRSLGRGYRQEFIVDITGALGIKVSGTYEEKKFFWIRPVSPRTGSLEPQMSFIRDHINGIYSVRIKPDMDVVASIKVVRGWMLRSAGRILLSLGILLCILCSAFYLNTRSFVHSAQKIEGRVTGWGTREIQGAQMFFPVIQFAGSDRREHEITSSMGSSPPRFRKGQVVPILFNPQYPDKACINEFFEVWCGVFVSGLFAGIALILGFVFIVTDRLMTRGGWAIIRPKGGIKNGLAKIV